MHPVSRGLILAGILASATLAPRSLPAQAKQAPVNSSFAPVPSPIQQGKKAFISFELGDVSSFPSTYSGGPERAYNEFYQGMKQWGRYQLVDDPKDADVIFAIRFVDSPGLSHPNIALWGFAEEINTAYRKKNRDASFSATVMQVVSDVQQLLATGGGPAQP
jgi:hypothetical protein